MFYVDFKESDEHFQGSVGQWERTPWTIMERLLEMVSPS